MRFFRNTNSDTLDSMFSVILSLRAFTIMFFKTDMIVNYIQNTVAVTDCIALKRAWVSLTFKPICQTLPSINACISRKFLLLRLRPSIYTTCCSMLLMLLSPIFIWKIPAKSFPVTKISDFVILTEAPPDFFFSVNP